MKSGLEPRSENANVSNDAADIATRVQAANECNSLRSLFERGANILRYYRKSQLMRRALRVALPFLNAREVRPLSTNEQFQCREAALEDLRKIAATRTARSSSNLSEDLQSGRFTLLNQAFELGNPIDWHGTRQAHPSRLWSFQLQYHEYLLDLATCTPNECVSACETVWNLVADWMSANPPETARVDGNAWHPYCISRRLPVWAQLLAVCEPPAELRDPLLHSFANQAEVLSNHLEFDLGGNHLLENLRGLVFAGIVIDGSRGKRWLEIAEQQLRIELPRQILAHGEHYERSPMYHCQVLGNLLQIICIARSTRDSLADYCYEYASQMLEFLRFLLHPDEEIPLFGDSCFGEAHSVAEIERLAKMAGFDTANSIKQCVTIVDRYWKWQHNEDSLIFDAGPVGAEELPAHAHCDLLGFEASIDGRRWFVDSGVFDYDDGPMRAYCRSSAAHNVVTVDLKNNCDVWSRFRMGRKGRPRSFNTGEQQDFSWCLASHDGYRHLGIPELARLLLAHADGTLACLEYASDFGNQALVGRLHLAPEVNATVNGDARVLLNVADSERWLFFTPGVMLELSEGWYCDQFGKRTRTQVINYRPKSSSNTCDPFGWALSTSQDTDLSVTPGENFRYLVELTTGGSSGALSIQFPH